MEKPKCSENLTFLLSSVCTKITFFSSLTCLSADREENVKDKVLYWVQSKCFRSFWKPRSPPAGGWLFQKRE